ncbi:hypothetical protein DVA81_18425, partial [Acinetobacter baumannii]
MKQHEEGSFINQHKYTVELLKKFGMENSKHNKTPMSSNVKMEKDES